MLKSLELCLVSLERRVIDAMKALDCGGVEIALVIDGDDRVVGILTDGDIRRALLAGATLESPLAPFVQRRFTAVGPQAGRTEVLELMRARTIAQVPVLDGSGRLVGLHLLHDIVGCAVRPQRAVIMAGGKGTRLKPLTDRVPKPMIRVAGRPILERLVLHLVGCGIRHIVLSINYLGHVIEEHFGRGERFGCRIDYLRETKPLGTGGALAMLPDLADPSLLVVNGDLVTQADVGALLDFHELGGFDATLAVREYSHTVPFGCVEVQGDQIVQIEEKPVVTRLINAGIYVLDPGLITQIPPDTEYPITALLEHAVASGGRVGAWQIVDDWLDVGHHDQLRIAREGAA
jgi:dTDP-glucose pyrophosphorylase